MAEWLRAYASLQAAANLTRDGLYADAISRAYYAILHAAKAGLHVHDVAAESHAAVRRMFGLHLIKSGEIERRKRVKSFVDSWKGWMTKVESESPLN